MLKRGYLKVLPLLILLLISSTGLAGSFPITITDDLGHEVFIEERPQRIVSMTPSTTEILFALDLEEAMVGVTEYCNYPEAAITTEKIGGVDAGLEPVLAQEPDLVVCTTMNTKETVERLKELGIPVIVIDSSSYDDIYPSISLLGEATGQAELAQEIVKSMKKEKEALQEKLALVKEPPLVFYEVWDDPFMSVNKDTFIGELILLAGGKNLTHDAASTYPIVSIETIIDKNPQVYILPTGHGNIKRMRDIETRPGFEYIDAIIKDQVYFVDQDIISRPGPRVIEALEIFARAMHPQLF